MLSRKRTLVGREKALHVIVYARAEALWTSEIYDKFNNSNSLRADLKTIKWRSKLICQRISLRKETVALVIWTISFKKRSN